MLADSELREYRVCLWNGDAAGVQRGRGYGDADSGKFLRLLAAGDSLGICFGASHGLEGKRSVRFDCCGGVRDCVDGCALVPPREMEGAADLSNWERGTPTWRPART